MFPGENAPRATKLAAVGGYLLCSLVSLLANKAALKYFDVSTVLAFIQIVSSILLVLLLKYSRKAQVDSLEWEKFKPFSVYTILSFSATFAYMRVLQLTNLETALVFRACVPIAVAFIEHLYLNRAMPNMRSWLSIIVVVIGAITHCLSDSIFYTKDFITYSWVSLYLVLATVEMTYGKLLTEPSKNSMGLWGPVLYQNLLLALPMLMYGYMYGDYEYSRQRFLDMKDQSIGYSAIAFSCVVGTVIGYSNWACRSMVSAASFSLIDVINKLVAVLINALLWESRSSSTGVAALCLCLFAGAFYQQAPRREFRDSYVDKLMN